MPSKKLLATGLLTFVMVTQLSLAAFAEDDSNEGSGSSATSRPVSPLERNHHAPAGEADDNYRISVPPVVITPDGDDAAAQSTQKPAGASAGRPTFRVSPPKGVSKVAPDATGKASVVQPKTSSFDPEANAPIEISNIRITKKTPADVFMESAQIGIGAMAAGAALLGVTAAVRGVRFRRQSKTDFIYEVEN